jgi:Protein of unknown function (DUF3060)
VPGGVAEDAKQLAVGVGHPAGAQGEYLTLGGVDVVDPDVEVELLRSARVGKPRRLMLRGVLEGEATALRVGQHHPRVGVLFLVDGAAEYAGIERRQPAGVFAVDDDRTKLSDHGAGVAAIAPRQTVVWDHLAMNPQDDPEARIRELEQPLADVARASELGTGHSLVNTGNTTPLPPPLPPNYGTPYDPSAYGAPYGQPTYGQPMRRVSKGSGAMGWLIAGITVVILTVGAGIAFVTWNAARPDRFPTMPSFPSIGSIPPTVPGGGGSLEPTAMPEIPAGPTVAPPGAQLSVSGVGKNETIACDANIVSVSGVSNTVTITGQCTSVTVSGMNNIVTVDAAGTISASGFDNRVVYHSGTPEIQVGGSNVVEQG